MQEADADAIAQMEKDCFDDPWQKDSILFELTNNPFSRPFVIEEEGRLAGYAFLWVIFERAEIANIAIDASFRRRALGKTLLNHLIKAAEKEGCETLMLEVRPTNTAARALYEHAGFLEMSRAKNYYSNGEDAIVMALPLAPAL